MQTYSLPFAWSLVLSAENIKLLVAMMKQLKLVFLLCLCRSTVSCPAVGTCDCTDRGYNCFRGGVDGMKMGLDLTKADYNFTGNKATIIDKNVFRRLVKVKMLWLRRNEISLVSESAFYSNIELTRLDLSFNSIETLPPLLFSKTMNLREFYCHDNNLTSLDRNLFNGLSRLADVRIHNNQLARIDPGAFKTNKLLFELYLENNMLETAYWTWIKHFNHSSQYELYMDGNPWSCDCRMVQFHDGLVNHKWIRNINEKDRRFSIPSCSNLPGHPKLNVVDNKKLFCQSPSITSQSDCVNPCHVTYDEASTATLECGGEGVPTPKAQITDSSGAVRTDLKSGRVSLHLDPVSLRDAGDYLCVITGYNDQGIQVNKTSSIKVNVKHSPLSSAGIIAGVCVVLIILVGAIGLYRYRYKRRKGYGSLSDEVDIHYDVNDRNDVKNEDDLTNLDRDGCVDHLLSNDYVGDGDKEVLV